MDFVGERVGGVGRREEAASLEYGGAVVEEMVDEVDGDAALRFVVGDNGFVDVVAVHAFAAVAWEKCGVDVEYAVREGVDEVVWDEE